MTAKHADVYCKGDINIDDLPDTAGESEDEKSAASSPVPQRRRPSPQPSAVPSVTSMNESMKRYYEDMMKKCLQSSGPDVLTGLSSSSVPSMTLLQAIPVPTTSKQQPPPTEKRQTADGPLDLSAPSQHHPRASTSSVSGQYMSGNEDSR